MGRFRVYWLLAVALAAFTSVSRAGATNLVFDAITKHYNAKVGEPTAEFEFAVTNTGPDQVTINSVRASCGCTTPKMPVLPWKLDPGTNGTFHVTVDLRGKFGEFQKTVFMETTEGPKMLYVGVNVPASTNSMAAMNTDSRTRAMQIALADRQAIFRGECASCHGTPAIGKKGEQLFSAACAICHESEQRAVLVPDLHALKQTPTSAYWDAWVRNGKVGTMMPAFSQVQQGPLTDDQIESLVAYLMTDFSKRPIHGKTLAATPGPAVTHPPVASLQRPVTNNIALPGNLPVIPPVIPAQPNSKN